MTFVRPRRHSSVVLLAAVAVLALSAAPASAGGRTTPGHLDPGFGNQGKVLISLGGLSGANAIVALANGKLLVAGFLKDDILVMRFTAGGHLDPNFGGGDGRVTTSFAGRASSGQSIAVVAGGKILVGGGNGTPGDGSTDNLFLVRYRPDGRLDHTFGGGDGKLMTDLFGDDDQFYDMSVGDDGRAAVAAMTRQGGTLKPAVVRYTANGSLDHSFSGDGIEILPTAGNPFVEAVTVLASGKVVAAGEATHNGNPDFVLFRVKAGGGLDGSFGTVGTVFTDFDSNSDVADALAVDSRGRILAGGAAFVGGEQEFALARYTTSGDPDTAFSGDGKASTDIGPDFDRIFALTLEGGRIVAGGRSNATSTDERWALARYRSGGKLDAGFGNAGTTTTNFFPSTSKEEELNGLAVQPTTGRIVGGGDAGGRTVLAGYVG
ncbi:MAG: hypothetical protein ACJ77A_16140 [Actinomycetota bacterium]